MQNHLQICTKLSDQVKAKIKSQCGRAQESNTLSDQTPTNRTVDNPMDRFVQKLPNDTISACHRDLALALITSNIAFSFLDNEYFKSFLARLVPSYKLPDRYHGMTKTLVPQEYQRIRNFVDQALSEADYVSLSTDGWSDINQRFFLNLLVHTPKPWLHLFEDVTDESETGEKIYEFLKFAVEDLGPKRLAGLVSDHAPAMVKAWRLLKADYPWLQTQGCKAHAFNLLIKDIVESKHFDTFISTCNNLITFFTNKLNGALLREAFNQANVAPIKFVKACITRWNTHYESVRRILRMRKIIQAALYSPNLDTHEARCLRSRVSSDAFWDKAQSFVDFLKPIAEVMTLAQSDSVPASECFSRIDSAIDEAKKEVETSTLSKATKVFVKKCIDERKEFLESKLPYLHALLDPYTRGKNLTDTQRNIGRYILRTEISQHPDFGQDLIRELHEWEGRDGNTFVPCYTGPESEPWIALKEGSLSSKSWWQIYFPNTKLGKLSTFLNSIPISSAASERTWSIRGAIQSKARNRLLVDTTHQLAFVKYNLLLMKLKVKPIPKLPIANNDAQEVEVIDSDEEDDDDNVVYYDSSHEEVIEIDDDTIP
uniref:DUF659 domain-containing protein n=1 Tax=Panagrellus redivivus TaxID=6233 RepID=A0A7E4VIJ1_PANRE